MPYEIYIQTRPEGMVYGYDPYNQRMANYDLLKAEVQRGLKLLKRDHLDFLNLGFLKSALEHDPNYLHEIANNVRSLKQEGLILLWEYIDRWSLRGISRIAYSDGEHSGSILYLTDRH